MNEFIRLKEIIQSVKQERRGTITAFAYRCPDYNTRFTLNSLNFITIAVTITIA